MRADTNAEKADINEKMGGGGKRKLEKATLSLRTPIKVL